MPNFDLPLSQLESYVADVSCPADFDAFWQGSLADARELALDVRMEQVTPIPGGWVDVFDVSFTGFGGQRVKAWFLKPAFTQGDVPLVTVYHGYSGGRGDVLTYAPWVLAGCAVLTMDTRGQGGHSGNAQGYDNPAVAGWMTQGLLSKEQYYYRAVFTDAVRLLDVAHELDGIDTNRIAVTGASQGGGITLAAAALDPRVALCMPDVPFLQHYRRSLEMATRGPYLELVEFFRRYPDWIETGFKTLEYFDGMFFAERLGMPSLWSVALLDDICPASTVFASYNRVKASKSIEVYPYSNHENGPTHALKRLAFLRDAFGLA